MKLSKRECALIVLIVVAFFVGRFIGSYETNAKWVKVAIESKTYFQEK